MDHACTTTQACQSSWHTQVRFGSQPTVMTFSPHVMGWASMSQTCRACTRVLLTQIPVRSAVTQGHRNIIKGVWGPTSFITFASLLPSKKSLPLMIWHLYHPRPRVGGRACFLLHYNNAHVSFAGGGFLLRWVMLGRGSWGEEKEGDRAALVKEKKDVWVEE